MPVTNCFESIHLEWLLLTSIFILPSPFQGPLIRKGEACREWYKPQSMSPRAPTPLLYLLCNDRMFINNVCFITTVHPVHKDDTDHFCFGQGLLKAARISHLLSKISWQNKNSLFQDWKEASPNLSGLFPHYQVGIYIFSIQEINDAEAV